MTLEDSVSATNSQRLYGFPSMIFLKKNSMPHFVILRFW